MQPTEPLHALGEDTRRLRELDSARPRSPEETALGGVSRSFPPAALGLGVQSSLDVVHSVGRARSSASSEVYESVLEVGVNELDTHPIANLEPAKAADQFPLCRGARNSNPRPFGRGTGDEGVESLSNVGRQEERGGGLPNPPFYLSGIVLLLCTMQGERIEFLGRVRRRAAGHRRFQQPQRDQIGEAAVRRSRVRVVLERKAEVP